MYVILITCTLSLDICTTVYVLYTFEWDYLQSNCCMSGWNFRQRSTIPANRQVNKKHKDAVEFETLGILTTAKHLNGTESVEGIFVKNYHPKMNRNVFSISVL